MLMTFRYGDYRMNNITQLLREQKEEFEKLIEFDESTDDVWDWHTTSLIAIIRNEIERKKGMQKYFFEGGQTEKALKVGYNTAITEDIAYWENVLKEIEKNV